MLPQLMLKGEILEPSLSAVKDYVEKLRSLG
jgi:hypothetical protein